MSSQLNNPLDNSDVPIRENKHSIVGGYFQSLEAASEMKLYLENLKLLAEMGERNAGTKAFEGTAAKVIQIDVGADPADKTKRLYKPVKLGDLLPKESEFDRGRRIVISKLNAMNDDELRVWMARFGSDSIFELSALITSYGLDKKKRDEAFDKFNIWKP